MTQRNVLNRLFKGKSPNVRYANGYSLEGTLLIKPNYKEIGFNTDLIKTVDWSAAGVNIKNESKWKNNIEVSDSIQLKIIEDLKNSGNYDLIFNDDGSGECADIVAINYDKEDHYMKLELYHCKFSSGDKPGKRIKDLYEVCGQAQKSIKWNEINKLMKHIKRRGGENLYRFENGDNNTIETIIRVANYCNKIDKEIIIVQPGLSKSEISDSQKRLLEVTEDYLKKTYNFSMRVIGSK